MDSYLKNLRNIGEIYLKNNIPLILLNGINPNGTCTCRKSDCAHKGKHPVQSKPNETALLDASEIGVHFSGTLPYNLAAWIRQDSGLIIIDVDKKNGGFEAFKKLENDFGTLPLTTKVNSGGGGFHLYYRLPEGLLNLIVSTATKNKYEGIDFITNGNIVIPGSRHHSMNYYTFDSSLESQNFSITELPESICKGLAAVAKKSAAALTQNVDEETINEGGRNNSLFKIALNLFSNNFSDEDAWSKLCELNSTKCNPPLAESELRSIFVSARKKIPQSYPYSVINGHTHVEIDNEQFEVGNFHIALNEQLKIDDGSDNQRTNIYLLKIVHPKIQPDIIKVSPEELESGTYLEKTDARLIIKSHKMKDHLRKAVRLLGDLTAVQEIKIHTGWTKLNGENVFITNSGAIGANGLDKNFRTHEDYGGPSGYTLSLAQNESDFQKFSKILADLVSVADPKVTYPLLASVFRAPLYSMLPTDFSVGVIGKTGSMKSTLAALFLSFYGTDFSVSNLPENFGSTPNAIELKTFLHKDVPLVIDDYVVGEINSNQGEKIFRSIGNRNGRHRLTKDILLRSSYIPRGLILFTGEDMNLKQSVRARMVLTYSESNSIDKKLLTDLQRKASHGELSKIMGEYVKWIAANFNLIAAAIKDELYLIPDKFNAELLHTRTAPNLSNLYLGITYFLKFCAEKNIFSEVNLKSFETNALNAFASLIKVQNEHQTGADPVESFLLCLRGAIEASKAHIKLEHEPALRVVGKFLGYRSHNNYGGQSTYQPTGDKIGLISGGQLMLHKDKTMLVVKDYARSRNIKFDISVSMLATHLKDKGLLITDPDRTTIKRTFEGNRERCWLFDNWLRILEPDFYETHQAGSDLSKATLNNLLSAPNAPLFTLTESTH